MTKQQQHARTTATTERRWVAISAQLAADAAARRRVIREQNRRLEAGRRVLRSGGTPAAVVDALQPGPES